MPDMMGCIGSHLTRVMHSISETISEVRSSRRNCQNIFNVLNVDDLGRHLAPGKLEVTESDLVLRIPGKAPLTWPLRCLRRYGYENDLFSFESGRRCPTGAGIYAFKCSRAQTIFNLLQAKIQVGNLSITLPPASVHPEGGAEDDTPVSMSPTFDYVNISEGQGHVHRNYTPTAQYTNIQTDTEPDSPQSPPGVSLDHGQGQGIPFQHPLYMNVESQKKNSTAPIYQNHSRKCNGNGHRRVLEGLTPSVPLLYKNDLNFNTREERGGTSSIYYTNVECRRKSSVTNATSAPTPEVNYAELDLEQTRKLPVANRLRKSEGPQHSSKQGQDQGSKLGLKPSKSVGYTSPQSNEAAMSDLGAGAATQVSEVNEASGGGELGYATIDFDRTAALSGVTRTKIKLDFHSTSMDKGDKESDNHSSSAPTSSSRKTRHNSTAI